MKCLNCQKELPDQAMFCAGCGKRIPRCPTCKTLLTSRIRFCPKDGTPIPAEILELIPEPAPTPEKKSFCTRCGKPCASGQKICDVCLGKAETKPAKPVKKTSKKEPGKKKKRLWPVLILLLLLILGLAALGYYAVSHDLLSFPWLEDFSISSLRDDAEDRDEKYDKAEDQEHEEEGSFREEDPISVTEAPAPATEAPAEVTVPGTEAPVETVPATEPPAPESPAPEASTESPGEPDPLASLQAGDTFFLGTFEQDNKQSNGAEDIEWIVLEKTDDRMLVVSRYLLDSRRYHSSNVDVSWSTCSLRTWMNDTFYRNAFTSAEKERILTCSDPDSAAEDKVFLLDLDQVERFFPTDSSRICRATKYAVSRDAYVNSSTGGSWWLLRTAGVDDQHVVSVNSNGTIDYTGGLVDASRGTVRPALWIRIG